MNPVIDQFGVKRWYQGTKLHREDGPAVEYPNGTKVWYQDGKLHREDGPAGEWAEDGTNTWYLNNERVSELDFSKQLIKTTTDPDKVKSLKSRIIKLTLNESSN